VVEKKIVYIGMSSAIPNSAKESLEQTWQRSGV